MTVIRPNSISGVTSITAHSQSIEFYKSDGNLSGANLDGVNINTAGILTAANFKTGVSNLHDVGLTLSGGQLDVGNNIKIGNSGVITATSFVGSGANLTNLDASDLASGTVPTARLGSGTANNTTFLRGDSTFQTVVTDLVNDSSPQLGGNLDVNTKNIVFGDSSGATDDRLTFGDGTDLSIYHDGFNSRIADGGTGYLINTSNGDGILFQHSSGQNLAKFLTGGAAELYHNYTKTFETTNEGATFDTGSSSCVVRLTSNTDAVTVLQGFNSDFNIKAPSGGAVIIQANASEDAIKCIANGAVELYHNGNRQVFTFDGGMNWQDNKKAEFGASGDLKIYHNGTDSRIDNGTNKLSIGNTHNNEIKFFTQNSTRWNVGGTGHIYPDLNNAYDIGTTTYRVRNIYTNDLNLSNKGSTNSVDNTWGDYTIQEGESDLFLINNRSGKKYKFNLTEVS